MRNTTSRRVFASLVAVLVLFLAGCSQSPSGLVGPSDDAEPTMVLAKKGANVESHCDNMKRAIEQKERLLIALTNPPKENVLHLIQRLHQDIAVLKMRIATECMGSEPPPTK